MVLISLNPLRFKTLPGRLRSLLISGAAMAVWLATACSSATEYPVITKDTAVSRENTIMVMGIQWVDTYNDAIGDREIKVLRSEDLLSDQKRLSQYRHHRDEGRLSQPLHYLANIRLEFMTPDETWHRVVRFSRDLNTYQTLALHAFLSGPVQLKAIDMDQYRFDEGIMTATGERRHSIFRQRYEEDFGAWNLKSGQVVYLGHLTLDFRTRRFVLGLITPEEFVDRIRLTRLTLEDRFEETREQLRKDHPWFPVGEMINLSADRQWVYESAAGDQQGDPPPEPVDEKPDERSDGQTTRDRKKFFF
jgi:hypothetical protein